MATTRTSSTKNAGPAGAAQPAPSARYRDALVARHRERAAQLPGAALPWLAARRQAAITRFADLGFPTTRDEDWKYTSLGELVRAGCVPSGGEPRAPGAVMPAIGPFVSANITRLVFIDGRFSPSHSQIGPMPEGAWVTGLGRMLAHEPALVEPHLGRLAEAGEDGAGPFTALNTAFTEDGAFIHIPEGSYKELPIHLMYIATPRGAPLATHPRNLVVAQPGSRVSIVEHYVGTDPGVYLTNAVTEMHAGAGATIEHYKLQHESDRAFHIAHLAIAQERGSSVASHSIAEGAHLSRHAIAATLAGERAACSLYGLYMMDGDQHSDHVTLMDHATAGCTSNQLFKGIVGGAARGVFTGRVLVREDAQQTSAHQSNNNLLLSEQARVESRPQLEIYADDVRCTHGSTVGRLDEDAIFYLRSRGVGEADARRLLTYAFASEILKSIRVKLFRNKLEELFMKWLPAGRMLGGTNGRHSAPSDG